MPASLRIKAARTLAVALLDQKVENIERVEEKMGIDLLLQGVVLVKGLVPAVTLVAQLHARSYDIAYEQQHGIYSHTHGQQHKIEAQHRVAVHDGPVA